ncbi:MAG: hypothetical protein GQ545_09650 [Candidatus Aminicenantes bacterium]|nr:hypothetical protein [Candidatus Aminicenantes bacterium]
MADYQKRRQKALLKKRRKEKEKRKKQSRSSSLNENAHKIYLIKNAKNCPLFECLINTDWQDKGLAHILLSRRQPNNKLILGVYLVDIFCLGLKNTFSNANMSIEEYQKMKLSLFEETAISTYSPGKAYRIIIGAIEYAKRIGFKPQKDFYLSKYILEELLDTDHDFQLEFGREGKPFFIAGPDDNVETIIETLRKNVGEGNFDFIVPLPLK